MSVADAESDSAGGEVGIDEALRRNSCVIAIPMEAKAREVRSQARKVRSTGVSVWEHIGGEAFEDEEYEPSAK